MSNQEAIALLRNLEDSLDSYCELNEEGKKAFRMAIESLELFGNSEQMPTAQHEQKYIDPCDMCQYNSLDWHEEPCESCTGEDNHWKPSASPTQTNTSKALEALDCISRAAAIDAADKIIVRDNSGNNDVVKAMTAWKEYIRGLPSAQPERLTDDEKAMIEFAENVIKDCVLLLMNEGGEKKTAFDFRYKDGKLYRMMVKEIGEE